MLRLRGCDVICHLQAHVLFLAVDNLTDVTSVANISVGCDSFFIPKELLPVMVVMKRGGCLFADKAMNAFSAGAIGMLVVDSFDRLVVDVPLCFRLLHIAADSFLMLVCSHEI